MQKNQRILQFKIQGSLITFSDHGEKSKVERKVKVKRAFF